MHQNFADWYRLVSIDPHQIPLAARWEVVDSYAAKATSTDIFDLIRLAFGRAPKGHQFESTFSAEFKEKDVNFSMTKNTLELELLATATLIQLMGPTYRAADQTALAIVCGQFQGLGGKPKIDELGATAKIYLHTRSDNLRKNNGAPSVKLAKSKIPELIKEIASPTWPTDAPKVGSALEEANKQVALLARSCNEALADLTRRLQLQQEESNILWWVFSGFSRDLEVTISSLNIPTAAVVAGKELADRVINLPGPVAASAFLDKIITYANDRGAKSEYSIKEAVNSRALKEWKAKYLSFELSGLEDFCSLAYALKQSDILQSSTTWVPDFETKTMLMGSSKLPPTAIAEQMYRECLLIRSLKP